MGFHRYLLALALALAGGGAYAQAVNVPDSAFQRFLVATTGVGQQTIGFSGSGQPVPQMAGHQLAPDGQSSVKASATGILRNSAGGQIPVSLTGRVTPAVIASFIKRATPLALTLSAGVAIYDFAKESGFELSRDPATGALIVTKPTGDSCAASPCYEYSSAGVGGGAWLKPSAFDAAARQYIAQTQSPRNITSSSFGTFQWFYNYVLTAPCCGGVPAGTTGSSSVNFQRREIAPYPAAQTPSSLDAFETYILQGNPYPVSSSVAEAIEQARQLLKEPVPLAQPQVTGPPNSPGTTSTTTKADGSTVTVTNTYNHNYAGDTINTTTTTVTSTVPAGGGPVQTETSVQTPEIKPQEPEPFTMPCGIAGTPPCAVKVDEEGMPTEVEELKDPQKMVDDSLEVIDGVEESGFWPSLPQFSWSFALPTGCSVISVPAFDPFLPDVDVCQFQPMFHSIMSLVWLLGGLFGAISIFWRNALSPAHV